MAKLAVRQLERAISQLDSGSLSRRGAWIVRKDPDLAGLRGTSDFQAWQARYLPRSAASVTRPANVDSLELILHAARMLGSVASALADEWRRRAGTLAAHDGGGAGALLRTWLEQEAHVVAHFAATARDHRHWQTRAATLHELERWAADNARMPLPAHYRDYGDDPLPWALSDLDRDPRQFEDELGDVLGKLAHVRAPVRYGEGSEDHHVAWLEAIKQTTVVTDAEHVCIDRAQLWDWLTNAIDERAVGGNGAPPRLRGPIVSRRKVRPRRAPG